MYGKVMATPPGGMPGSDSMDAYVVLPGREEAQYVDPSEGAGRLRRLYRKISYLFETRPQGRVSQQEEVAPSPLRSASCSSKPLTLEPAEIFRNRFRLCHTYGTAR
jgi:hypothetical protein